MNWHIFTINKKEKEKYNKTSSKNKHGKKNPEDFYSHNLRPVTWKSILIKNITFKNNAASYWAVLDKKWK